MSLLIEELDKEIDRLSAIKSLADGMQSYCKIFGQSNPYIIEMHLTDGDDRYFLSDYYFHSIFVSYESGKEYLHEQGFPSDLRLELPNGNIIYARFYEARLHSFSSQLEQLFIPRDLK